MVSTSQPALGDVIEKWEELLRLGYDGVVYIPMSSGLLALATCGHIGYGGLGVGVSCMPRVEGLSPE